MGTGDGSRSQSIDLPVVLMRGGTSKGVFVHERDLPPDGPERDALLLSLMGSPDPMQLDGLGGTTSSTSKVVAVAGSSRPGCDLDYTFYQVGIDRPTVDSKGNCGNLTAAVAPYAIDEGMLDVTDGLAEIVLYNVNTGRRIVVHVPVEDGRFAWAGDFQLEGVPGTAARVVTEYLDPAGAVTGRLLPTGAPLDRLGPRVGESVEVSIVDVTTPVVMIAADVIGIAPTIEPSAINADEALLERIESIRAAAAVAIGLANDEDDALARSPALPRVAILGPACRHSITGRTIDEVDHDLVVRSSSMQRAHHAIPLTSAMCVAAASLIPGTVAYMLHKTHGNPVRLAHPKGIATIGTRAAVDGSGNVRVIAVSVDRTARRMLSGTAHVDVGRP
jgi:2-methylaconitate isomerase